MVSSFGWGRAVVLFAVVAGGQQCFAQLAANSSAADSASADANLSADPSASGQIVGSGGGRGHGAQEALLLQRDASARSLLSADTAIRPQSAAPRREAFLPVNVTSYGPNQPMPLSSNIRPVIGSIHISSGLSRNTLSIPAHALSAPPSWGGHSAATASKPLYSTMMKLERPSSSGGAKPGRQRPGMKKSSSSALQTILGR